MIKLNERYNLIRQLGGNPDTVVYLAIDRQGNNQVALKVSKLPLQYEFNRLRGCFHSQIPRAYDYGALENDSDFLAMQYFSGRNLIELVERRDIGEIVKAMTSVCDPIAHIHHDVGIVHGDLKPLNMICDGETTYLIDLGNFMEGTPFFLSPERRRGEGPTPSSDIYAFGRILYHLLAGDLSRESIDLNKLQHVPDELKEIIIKCTEKDPFERYLSIMEVKEALTSPSK